MLSAGDKGKVVRFSKTRAEAICESQFDMSEGIFGRVDLFAGAQHSPSIQSKGYRPTGVQITFDFRAVLCICTESQRPVFRKYKEHICTDADAGREEKGDAVFPGSIAAGFVPNDIAQIVDYDHFQFPHFYSPPCILSAAGSVGRTISVCMHSITGRIWMVNSKLCVLYCKTCYNDIEVTRMPDYEKKGYLVQDFRVFRLSSPIPRPVPFHFHDFHKIILFLDVKGDYIIEGTTYPLGANDIAFVRAGEIHRPAVDGKSPYERIVIYISPSFLARVSRPGADLASCFQRAPGEAGVMRLASGHTHELLSQMEKLEKTARGEGFANGLYTEAQFIEFMILLHRALFSHELGAVGEAEADEKIQPLLGYIESHLSEDLSADILAQAAFLSKYYLMRRFKAATGYSLHRYVTMKRLLYARSLLEAFPKRSVSEVSAEAGFSDYSAFFRAFKAQFSVTPQEWRKMHRN